MHELQQHALDAERMFVDILQHQNAVINIRQPGRTNQRDQHGQVSAPQLSLTLTLTLRAIALPCNLQNGILQRPPEMRLRKGVQLRCTKVRCKHRAAKGDDVMPRQQTQLDDGEIAVPTNQQGIVLLASRQSVPVDGFQ
ncbi:hypothetical protein D3C80_1641870 [compost metagenome]